MTEKSSPSHQDARAVRRGRIFASLLFAIAIGPLLLATAMYYWGWGIPDDRSNKGQLLLPVGAVTGFGFEDEQDVPLETRFGPTVAEPTWMVILLAEECGPTCRTALYETRQVHIALGKEAPRVQRAAWVPDLPASALEDYEPLLRVHLAGDAQKPAVLPGAADLGESYQLYVVDPNGNVVLRYDSSHSGEDLLDDLKRLLRISTIG